MLAMLGMCPCNMFPVAGIATDGLIISVAVVITADITIVIGRFITIIVSACCTIVRGWLLSLVCTGVTIVRGSVSFGTTLIASIVTTYLTLLRLFVGAF